MGNGGDISYPIGFNAEPLRDLIARAIRELARPARHDDARRRLPVVAVTSYRCPTCSALHAGRTATLQLGCDGLRAA